MSSTKLFLRDRMERQFKAQAGIIGTAGGTNGTNGATHSPPNNGKPNGKGTNLKSSFVHPHAPRTSAQSQFVARR